MIQTLAVKLEGLRIAGRAFLEIAALPGVELQAELARSLSGDLILDGEDVSGMHIEALCPHGLAGCGSEQLHADADAVSRLLQAACQHSFGIEVAGDFERIAVLAGVFSNGVN
jgi:hypothetical protein